MLEFYIWRGIDSVSASMEPVFPFTTVLNVRLDEKVLVHKRDGHVDTGMVHSVQPRDEQSTVKTGS